MKTDLFKRVRTSANHWWVSLVIGLLSVAIAGIFIFQPLNAFYTLTILFVAGFFIAGISEIVFAISNKDFVSGWGWTLAAGIIDILLGILLLCIPESMPWAMIYFVGFWILFQSIWGIGISVDLQRAEIKEWGWMLALSILGVIFSFIFLISPMFASEFIVIMAILAFLMYGIFRIYLAIKLKSLKNRLEY